MSTGVGPVGRSLSTSREAFEKQRLASRVGNFERHDRSTIGNPFHIEKDGGWHQPEASRLKATSTSMELKLERVRQDHAAAVQRAAVGREQAQRDDARWSSMQATAQADAARVARFREEGLKSKRNESSVPYDTINLQYGNSQEVSRLGS